MSASEISQRESNIAFEVVIGLGVEVSDVVDHSRSVTNKGFSTLSRLSMLMLRRTSILQITVPDANMETGSDIELAMRVTLTGKIRVLH